MPEQIDVAPRRLIEMPPPPPADSLQTPAPPAFPRLPNPVGPREFPMPSPLGEPPGGGSSTFEQKTRPEVSRPTPGPPRKPAPSAEIRPATNTSAVVRNATIPPVVPSHACAGAIVEPAGMTTVEYSGTRTS